MLSKCPEITEREDGRAYSTSKGFHVKSSDLAMCSNFILLLWHNSLTERNTVEKFVSAHIPAASITVERSGHIHSQEQGMNARTLTCLCVLSLISSSHSSGPLSSECPVHSRQGLSTLVSRPQYHPFHVLSLLKF